MAGHEPNGVRYMKVKEVAAMARVNPMTIYRLVDSGELAAVRVGKSIRIPEPAALALLGQDTPEPPG
jgi:excisionase family DNA binding protein